MCSDKCQNLIDEVLSELVDGNESFTAYDVSKKVQGLLDQQGLPFERHIHMRAFIHNLMDNCVFSGEYEKELRNVSGAAQKAWVYFPTKLSNTPLTLPAKTLKAITKPCTYTVQAKPPKQGRKVDARGTLCVPANLVRKAGFDNFVFATSYKNCQLVLQVNYDKAPRNSFWPKASICLGGGVIETIADNLI